MDKLKLPSFLEYRPTLSRPATFIPFLRRFTDERTKHLEETKALYEKVSAEWRASQWSSGRAANDVSFRVFDKLLEFADKEPQSKAVDGALTLAIYDFLDLETHIFTCPEIDFNKPQPIETLVEFREHLRRQQYFLAHQEALIEELVTKLGYLFAGLLRTINEPPSDDPSPFLVPLYTFVDKFNETFDKCVLTVTDDEVLRLGLFKKFHDTVLGNVCRANDVLPTDTLVRPLKLAEDLEQSPDETVDTLARGTPLHNLFLFPIPLPLPQETRFSHHWIVSPPGTGKSTTLQLLINKDLDAVARGEASVIVIESNRDLIKSIEGLARFGPGGDLEGRLISIDVEDVEHPIALNIFDLGLDDMKGLSPRDREALLNSATAMLDYTFRALLGAELTSRQSTLFNFTVQLLLQIPHANLDTLIDLMQPKSIELFQEHVAKLEHDAKRFFEIKFSSDEFRQTKSQVVDRIFAIKRIRSLARIFSAEKTKLDLHKELTTSKVILINAAKSLLQEEGVEIFTRFFLALILLSVEKRQLQHKQERMDTFLYIDECQDVIRRDEKISILLDQARKLRLGLILAHQRLDQLDGSVLSALFGSTAIKFAAQVSDANAAALARNMETTSNFIRQQPQFSYACHIRGLTPKALSISVPFIDLNKEPRMSLEDAGRVREEMRLRYSQSRQLPPPTPEPAAVRPDPDSMSTESSDSW